MSYVLPSWLLLIHRRRRCHKQVHMGPGCDLLIWGVTVLDVYVRTDLCQD